MEHGHAADKRQVINADRALPAVATIEQREMTMTYQTVLEVLITNGQISESVADKVFTAYRKLKVLKYNAHDAYQIVHGGFFDRDTILRTVARYQTPPELGQS